MPNVRLNDDVLETVNGQINQGCVFMQFRDGDLHFMWDVSHTGQRRPLHVNVGRWLRGEIERGVLHLVFEQGSTYTVLPRYAR